MWFVMCRVFAIAANPALTDLHRTKVIASTRGAQEQPGSLSTQH